jgi:DedD protein
METQIKQRVIGILVLLVLVVAIALLLFYGAKQSNKSIERQLPLNNQEIANTEKPEIELSANGKSGVMSEPISPTPQDMIPPAKKDSTSPVSSEFGKVANPNEEADQIKEDQMKETFPSQITNETKPTTAIDTADNEKAVPLAKTYHKAKPPVTRKKPIVGNWIIKVGVFSVPDNAHSLVKKLQKGGYRAYTHLAVTSHGALTEVFIGPEKTYKNAQMILKNLHDKFHVDGIILKKHNVTKTRKIK